MKVVRFGLTNGVGETPSFPLPTSIRSKAQEKGAAARVERIWRFTAAILPDHRRSLAHSVVKFEKVAPTSVAAMP